MKSVVKNLLRKTTFVGIAVQRKNGGRSLSLWCLRSFAAIIVFYLTNCSAVSMQTDPMEKLVLDRIYRMNRIESGSGQP